MVNVTHSFRASCRIPPGDDQQRELARLAALGARVLADQPAGVSWVLLTDPEGNEFCLEG